MNWRGRVKYREKINNSYLWLISFQLLKLKNYLHRYWLHIETQIEFKPRTHTTFITGNDYLITYHLIAKLKSYNNDSVYLFWWFVDSPQYFIHTYTFETCIISIHELILSYLLYTIEHWWIIIVSHNKFLSFPASWFDGKL